METDQSSSRRLKLLVTIGCFGGKNLDFLAELIRSYKAMPMDVDIVVISEALRDYGPEVETVFESPETDPWFVPFGHKRVLSERVENYDLFIYSEDDMLATERNIRAFLDLSPLLAPDEIAGFLRYEIDRAGNWSFPEVHKSFHWKPETVRRRGTHLVAEFSCEHAAFYLLTQAQLKQCISHGRYLLPPAPHRYDFLCTGATDPYTLSGFRKVIGISSLIDFSIHHLPNRYVGQLGVSLPYLEQQVETMEEIAAGTRAPESLCCIETRFPNLGWSKSYYEVPNENLIRMVPEGARRLLSIGCGWGALEEDLTKKGMEITALPLDTIIGASAAERGIRIVYGSFDEGLRKLGAQTFDCVVVPNLLHLQEDLHHWLVELARLVGPGGSLVASGPNFGRLPWRLSRILGIGDFKLLKSFETSGINISGPSVIAKSLKRTGLNVEALAWFDHKIESKRFRGRQFPLGRFTARNWIIHMKR